MSSRFEPIMYNNDLKAWSLLILFVRVCELNVTF